MDAKPRRSPDVGTTALPDGHVVLVSKKTEWANTLSPLAALVWEFCDGSNSVEEIILKVRAIPGISFDETLVSEINTLLDELEESGFILV